MEGLLSYFPWAIDCGVSSKQTADIKKFCSIPKRYRRMKELEQAMHEYTVKAPGKAYEAIVIPQDPQLAEHYITGYWKQNPFFNWSNEKTFRGSCQSG